MASTDILIKGENALVKQNLLASDGTTPVLLSSLTYLSAQVIQFRRVLASYVYGTDAEIRQGDSTSQVEVEISEALSATFKEGLVTVRLTMDQADADFDVSGELRDIDDIEAFTVTL